MKNRQVFIAYAPRGPGLYCALAYLATELDVYGWFTGPCRDGTLARRFFLLENFHADGLVRHEAVDQADLHSAWSLDNGRRQELAAMQEAFAGEWLFYRDDPRAAAELKSYAAAGSRP